MFLFFFFQAEDGIRDFHVTGVQTCALPILERPITGDNVWGAARLYRRECLDQLLPLERRTGWDGMDVLEANLRGWKTGLVDDLPFFHHRREGSTAPSRRAQWAAQGRAAHYMGYRPSYLVMFALYREPRDPS